MAQKFSPLKFAISAGVVLAVCFAVTTIFAMLNIPGYDFFAEFLVKMYGFYGYSISLTGLIFGIIYGFLEGFIWFGLFALVYNNLTGKT